MIKLLFLGDICTDSYSHKDIEKFKSSKLYKFLNTYDGTIIGNLESPILEENIVENKNKFSLLNKPSFFEMYSFCSAFTLANNHIFDQEVDGFFETIRFLQSQNKGCFGAGENINEARKPFILTVSYITILIVYSILNFKIKRLSVVLLAIKDGLFGKLGMNNNFRLKEEA